MTPKDSKSGSWDTAPDPTTYDPSEFYTRATDKKGHSAQMYVRIPPELMSMIELLYQSNRFPYRTQQDLMRDALVHRIHALRQELESGKLDTQYAKYLAIHQILSEEEMDKEFRDTIQRLDTVVKGKMDDRALGKKEALRVLQLVLENIEAMPNEYQRDLYSKEIRGRFSYILGTS